MAPVVASGCKVSSSSRDIRNVSRGRCLSCDECPKFVSLSGRVLCDYCGCPPARHQQVQEELHRVVQMEADMDQGQVESDEEEEEDEEEGEFDSGGEDEGDVDEEMPEEDEDEQEEERAVLKRRASKRLR